MSLPSAIVIPTCQRSPLLDRTLESIRQCTLPEDFSTILVAENGEQLGAEGVVQRYHHQLPVRYHFSSPANKSHALNQALDAISENFVVFFDDDIRIGPGTLQSYSKLAGKLDDEFFAGGWCSVDYEEEPPPWLKKYLPPSAKGWSLGEKFCELNGPGPLGFNWCAFKSTVQRLGGFNPERGPGTKSRGQETDMQVRMLAAGVKGYYLPEARVWHYIPKDRCSSEWAINRVKQTAVYSGVELSKRDFLSQWRHLLVCRMRLAAGRRALRRAESNRERFEAQYKVHRNEGIMEGVALGRGIRSQRTH